MPFAGTGQRLANATVATFVLLAMAAAGVVWRAGDADATAPVEVAMVEPSASSTTSSSTTSSSTTSPSTTTTAPTTTSTTVTPKPVTTTEAPVRTTVPHLAPATTAPAPEPLPPTVPPRASLSPSPVASAEERCAAALEWLGQHGLALPAGWGFRCPGQALENGQPDGAGAGSP